MPAELAAVLRFEARHAHLSEAELAVAVRAAFGLSVLRYRLRLVRAIAHPAAEALEPATVRHLRALIARRNRLTAPRPTGATR